MKRSFFFHQKSSKPFFVNVKCSWDKTAEGFPPKVRKKFAQILEDEKNNSNFLNKKASPQNVPLHSQQFDNRTENILPKAGLKFGW